MKETINMQGTLRVIATDCEGNIVHDRHHANRIVTSGRRLVAELYAGVSGTPPSQVSHMAVGTGSSAAEDGQTALETERARNAIVERVYGDITDDGVARVRVQLQTVFDFSEANGAEPLREAGIFTAEADGVMYNRVVFDPVTKTDTFRLTLIWDIVF